MKAIRISSRIQGELEKQFSLPEGDLNYCSGLYLVTEDGKKVFEGPFSRKMLFNRFHVVSTLVDYRWSEIVKKENSVKPIFTYAS